MEEAKEYLCLVTEKLEKRLAELDRSLSEGEREVDAMNEYYWESYTEMDEYGYENFDNQRVLLTELQRSQESKELKRRFLRMLKSPYFGRVDFCFEGDDCPETFYIGLGNFSEGPGKTPLIYDWRAPVSGLFYDFDKGPAFFEAPDGEMKGEITSKWQYKIRNGKMVYAFESDVKIDDEILKAELAKNGDVRLKNIVSTIQREQNAIIRNTKDRILVVQGCAGSGKTSVALHRIAYLLYHDRKNLTSGNVLVLSPNGVFTDYISHILPELGEQNIREMSFDVFAYKELKDTASDCEDRYDEVERQLKGISSETARIKQSAEFAASLRGFALELEDDIMFFRDLKIRKTLIPAAQIRDLFYRRFPGLPLFDRIFTVMDYVVDSQETLMRKNFTDEEKQAIRDKFLRMYETRDLYVLYNRFLRRMGMESLPKLPAEERVIPYEDVYPILYLKYLLEAPKGHRQVKHLVIDEMQDYSYLQYLILQRLFPCSMTILGDKAQTLGDQEQDAAAFLPKLMGKGTRVLTMNRSYRSTVEIMDYAGKLKEGEHPDQIDRHGKEPEVFPVSSFQEVARAVLERERVLETKDRQQERSFETAAVLCLTESDAKEMYQAIRAEREKRSEKDAEMRLSYLDKNSSRFSEGLVVTTFYLAKGLEFDQVFAVMPREEKSPLIRQARYISCTRALHELYVMES